MAKEGQGESSPTSGSEFGSDFRPESGEGEGSPNESVKVELLREALV